MASERIYRLQMFIFFIISILIFFFEHPNFILNNGFGYLAYISYIPLLFLVRNISLKKSFLTGFIYGICSYGALAYWLFNYSVYGLIGVLFLYAVLYGFLFLILKYFDLRYLRDGWFLQWLLVCAFEYLKTKGFFGFNYGVTGYTQWSNPVVLQICDYIGIFGLTAIVIFPSFFIYSFIQKITDKRRIKNNRDTDNELYECKTHINYISKYEIMLKATNVVLPVLCFFMWAGLFYFVIYYGLNFQKEYSTTQEVSVALIQNNENYKEQNINSYRTEVYSVMKLTDEALEMNPEVQLVVWPETVVVPSIVYHFNEKNSEVQRHNLITNLLNYLESKNKTFVIGNGHTVLNTENKKEYYNSALVFDGNEPVYPLNPKIYSKQHLVPLSEYFPFADKFEKFNELLISNGFNLWIPGKSNTVFKTNGLSYSTPICFEDSFPDVCRKMVLAGSRAFINLSNDSWSKSKACQYQHLSMALVRCVENRVPAVRSTTSGQTCFIDCNGRITEMAPEFCSTYIIGKIPVIDSYEPGFYTKYGDIAGISFSVLSLVLLLITIITDIIKVNKSKKELAKHGKSKRS